MEFKGLFFVLFVVGCASAQTQFKVCIPSSNPVLCQSLDRDGSQAVCKSVQSKVDCALYLARGEADIGVFSEEEVLLLAQLQPSSRVVASIKDVNRQEQFAFEAVAVVPLNHTGGLQGLKEGRYCHPGLDVADLRWSPRVLRDLEKQAAGTDRCQDAGNKNGLTAEELEVQTLSSFFKDGCRPGPWSSNSSHDTELKRKYPSLCTACGSGGSCAYTINMGVNVAGVNNDNRHIQALQCLTTGGSVAYVAWQHVKEYFTFRYTDLVSSYALLCPDGQVLPLTSAVLNANTSPCAFVKQPWSAIVSSEANAATVQTRLQEWWPQGLNPGGNTWQATLYSAIVGGANARVVFESNSPAVANYTSTIRAIPNVDATASCLPAQRWCTVSNAEQQKCQWVRTAAYVLGLEPVISCQQRSNAFDCFRDIRDAKADFMAVDSNYGYLARAHYSLSPVKLVQNSRSNPLSFSRVAALVKETSAQSEVTRFENLKGKTACFPEFGGIAYVAFVRAGQERGVLSPSQCDYQSSVGEFFGSACAPGALDASHSLTGSSDLKDNNLCKACKSSLPGVQETCAFDYTNTYFGNNGSLACLAERENDIAFVQMQNVQAQMQALRLNPSDFRVLCRNNTLAVRPGVDVDENCLLAFVVDSEVLTRRHYSLSPVKLVQNSRSNPLSFSRVAALVKETSAQSEVTRFENLKGKTACFPEFGGIAYVAFVRAGQERGVLSPSQCDYQSSVGEFFGSACAPGALDASHSLTGSSDLKDNNLCKACKSSLPGVQETCAFDYTNTYFGNNGSLACLAERENDIAFVQMQNVQAQMQALRLNPSDFRVLCRNNTLAVRPGVDVDENCLLAFVVDSEVLTRRNDPHTNALNTLLDSLDLYFGYNAATGVQLINLEIYSPFDSNSHLLFKNSAVGLSEPSTASANEPSRNYIELFRHLEACTGAAPPLPGLASRSFYSVLTLVFMSLLTRFVIY